MNRRVVLLSLVVTLGLGVWYLLGTLAGADAPSRLIPEPTPGAGEATSETVDSDTEAEAVPARTEREVLTPEDAASSEGAVSFRVRVVRRGTKAPVPGAEVSYFQASTVQGLGEAEQLEFRRIAHDQEAQTRRFGTTVFADGDGLVSIPVWEHATVTGRHADLYGQILLQAREAEPEREHELPIEPDSSVTVQVLDNRGNPAVGVPILLIPQWEREEDWTFGARSMGETVAPEGLALVPHLQLVAPSWRARGPAPSDYLIRPSVPGITEGGESLDLEDLPSETVVLRLPPTGRVVVRLTDTSGGLLRGQESITLSIPSPDGEPTNRFTARSAEEQWQERRAAGAPAVFERVVLGRTYVAATRVSVSDLVTTFAGPVREDQELIVDLAMDPDTISLVGTALDKRFEPLRDRTLRFQFDVGRISGSLQAKTDGDGRFQVLLGEATANSELAFGMLELQPQEMTGWVASESAVLNILDPRPLSSGENELGDVILRPGPFIVEGRILVDDERADLTQWVGINVERALGSRTSTQTVQSWRYVQNVSIRHLVQGRFEVLGKVDPGRYHLRVNSQSHLPIEPVEFDLGEEDVELRLYSGGSVGASLMAEEGIRVGEYILELEATGDQVPGRESATDPWTDSNSVLMPLIAQAQFNQEGRLAYLWSAVWPGGYHLHVRVRGRAEPLHTVRDVQIVSGERTEDPRLQNIDLRGQLRVLTIEIVNADGERIVDASGRGPVALIHDEEPEAELAGFEATNGFARVPTAEPFLDLLVTAPGFRPQLLFGVDDDITARMEPFSEITVRIAGGMPVLPKGITLRISVAERNRQRENRRYSTYIPHRGGSYGGVSSLLRARASAIVVDQLGQARVRFGRDGIYRVRVSLVGTDRRSRTLEGTTPEEIQLRASGSPIVFEVRIPRESLDKVLRAAGF